eukprot:m.702657 g.702657  ORF g.702657 m.702657 type:complete len:96 (+) comp58712_c0_seq67:93-380(+)
MRLDCEVVLSFFSMISFSFSFSSRLIGLDLGAGEDLLEDETHLAATSGQPAVLSRPLRNPALASLLNQASAVCPWGFLLGCVMIAIFTDRVLGSA